VALTEMAFNHDAVKTFVLKKVQELVLITQISVNISNVNHPMAR
jgi:hypothetical protein